METFVRCTACRRLVPMNGSHGIAVLQIVQPVVRPSLPDMPPHVSQLMAAIGGREMPKSDELPFCLECAAGLVAAAKAFTLSRE